MVRTFVVLGLAALAGCVFDSAGLQPPAVDRPAGRPEATGVDGSSDAPPDAPPDAPLADHPDSKPLDGSADRAPDQTPDQTPTADAKKSDLAQPDLRKDLPKPDLPKPDLAKPDLPKPDLPKPDLPKPDLPKPPSCASLFPGYQLCTETAISCRIYFSGSSKSCKTVCGSHACLKAEDNDPNNHCAPEPNMSCGGSPCTCDSVLGDGICTCSKL